MCTEINTLSVIVLSSPNSQSKWQRDLDVLEICVAALYALTRVAQSLYAHDDALFSRNNCEFPSMTSARVIAPEFDTSTKDPMARKCFIW